MTKREAGFYWVSVPNRSPGAPTTSDVVSYTFGDGQWFFTGLHRPKGESEVSVRSGPLTFEPRPAFAAVFERLTAERDDLMSAISLIARERAELAANLTATQARCTELLDAERAAKRRIKVLEDEREALTNACHDLKAAASDRQAETIRRLRAVGYRVTKRCGSCVALAFNRE